MEYLGIIANYRRLAVLWGLFLVPAGYCVKLILVRSAGQLRNDLENEGFAIQQAVISLREVEHLRDELAKMEHVSSLRKRDGVFAVRNLLDASPAVSELARSKPVLTLVEAILGQGCFPVRGILFDKISEANWKVPWHQDLTIAVQERIEAVGFGPWSTKASVLHVQPPASVLEQMVSIRIHLDPCGEANGALRVIPRTHRQGRIPESDIQFIRQNSREHICEVELGGALLMRPLLLHASSPSLAPGHRRVIHLDFAANALPDGVKWQLGQSAHA